MSIQELSIKLKGFWNNTEYLLAMLIIAVSVASFFLGRFSVHENIKEIQQKAEVVGSIDSIEEKQRITVEKEVTKEVETPTEASLQESGGYVASKSGTKYHLPWCGSAKQIKEANKIWFATKEEAEKAGYTPASNCKGI